MNDVADDSQTIAAPDANGPAQTNLHWVLAAALWLPLVALYVASIARVPLHFDEYRTLFVVRESLGVLMADRMSNGHQPLYFLVAWLFARLTGSDGLVALRILPLAACFVSLGYVYAIVRHLVNRYAAVLAVTLCLLSGAFMWVSHNARPGGFLAMFVMAGTYYIVSAGDKPTTRRMVLIGSMTLLAMLSYNAAIPVVAVMMVGVLFVGQARWRLLLAQVVAVAVFVPWFIYTTTWYEAKEPLAWLSSGELIRWPGAVLGFTYNMDLLGNARKGGVLTLIVALVWLAHLAVIAYGFYRVRRFAVLFALMWFAQLSYGLYSLVVMDVNPMQVERYFIISVLFQSIAVAVALTSLPTRHARPKMVAALCAAVLLASAFGLYRKYQEPVPTRDMDFVRYLQDNAPDAELVYVFQNPKLQYQLDYFLKDAEVVMLARVFGLEPSGNIEKLGTPPIDVGQPMDPMPHADADELFFILHREEFAENPTVTHYAATPAMREKLDELIAAYDLVDVIQVESGSIYHMRRSR